MLSLASTYAQLMCRSWSPGSCVSAFENPCILICPWVERKLSNVGKRKLIMHPPPGGGGGVARSGEQGNDKEGRLSL